MDEKRIRKLSNQELQQGAAAMEQAGRQDEIVLFLDDLPLEIFVIILGMVGRKKELFPLRLVSKKWKYTVMDLLEPLTTPRETEWRPEEKSKQLALPAPKLIVSSTRTQFNVDAATSTGLLDIQPSAMTYPTKSMTVVFQKGAMTPTMLRLLFGKCGSTLKSLCIHYERGNAEASGEEVYKLLEKTRDLKVLKIFFSRLLLNDIPTCPTLSLSNLVTLSLGNVALKSFRGLLETAAKSLVTLELNRAILYDWHWDFKKYSEGLSGLQNLKLINPCIVGTFSGFPIPNLKRLSISSYEDVGKMFNFISKFQDSLVELTLELDGDSATDGKPLNLPKLTKLCLIGSIGRGESTMETQILLSSFPNVELLQLRTYSNLSQEEACRHSRANRYWGMSPNLKVIQWFTDQLLKKRVATYTFSRPE